jgi:hypothetical protein
MRKWRSPYMIYDIHTWLWHSDKIYTVFTWRIKNQMYSGGKVKYADLTLSDLSPGVAFLTSPVNLKNS